MYNRRKKQELRITHWLRKKFLKPKVDERFCQKCQQPFQKGQKPKPLMEFVSGSVGGAVYPAGTWRSNDVVVEVWRLKTNGNRGFYHSPYLSVNDLRDLMEVVVQSHRYIKTHSPQKKRRVRHRTG